MDAKHNDEPDDDGDGNDDQPYLCDDCGEDIHELGDYCMMRTEVWHQVMPTDNGAGKLCIACIEKRLGRKLTYEDFGFVPLNFRVLFSGSNIVRDRMNASGIIAHGLADLGLANLAFGIVDAIAEEDRALNEEDAAEQGESLQ